MSSKLRRQLIRLDPGGIQVKSRIRTGDVAVFITEERALKVHTKHTSSVESIPLVAGGSQWESAHLFKVGRSQENAYCLTNKPLRVQGDWRSGCAFYRCMISPCCPVQQNSTCGRPLELSKPNMHYM